MRFIFLGPPGAGKGTQADRLAAYLDVVHLSTGEMFREAAEKKTELGLLAEEYFKQGRLVPDEAVIKMVHGALETPKYANGFILDGYPRTIRQADSLKEYLASKNTPMRGVLQMLVPTEVLVDRLTARGRDDDERKTVEKRLNIFVEKTKPLADYYRKQDLLFEIDGEGTQDEVTQRIRSVVDPFRE